MNEEQAAHHQAQPLGPASTGASVGRRRLLKLGAGAVPVSLTLASRPVHALTCHSTSAWGSVQINPNTSHTHAGGQQEINSWKLSTWTTWNTPWQKLALELGLTGNNPDPVDQAKAKPVSILAAAPLSWPGLPAGIDSAATLFSVLSAGSDYYKYMVAAMLNYNLYAKYTGNTDASACLGSDPVQGRTELHSMLVEMLSGQYVAVPGATAWGTAAIKDYLMNNIVGA